MKEAINTVRIIGTLIDSSLEKKSTNATASVPSKTYITGNVSVKTVINGYEQIIDIPAFSNELTKAGAVNKIYKTLDNLSSQIGKRVSVTAQLTESKFVNDAGQLIKTNRLRLQFINVLSASDTDEDQATFDINGFIVQGLAPVLDAEKNITHYELKIAQPNYLQKAAEILTLAVDARNQQAIDYITNNYLVNTSVRLNGNVVYEVKTSERTQQVDFGPAKTQVFQRTIKHYFIASGQKDEVTPYTEDDMKLLKDGALVNDQETLEKKKSSGAVSSASKAPTPVSNAGKSLVL